MRGVAFQESAVFPVPALGAKALILYSIHCVNRNLGALKHELAVYLAAVAGSFAAAGTDGFHLLDGMGQLQKAGGTGETAVHKVRPQPIADDRNVQVHRDQKQLLGLRRGKELAFVTQHTGALPWAAVSARTISRMSMSGLTSTSTLWLTPRRETI